jgi:hypothetical protein
MMITSRIVSAPNSFRHRSMSAHICIAFSASNFLAFKNLHHVFIQIGEFQIQAFHKLSK